MATASIRGPGLIGLLAAIAVSAAAADAPLAVTAGADGRLWISERGRHLAELAVADMAPVSGGAPAVRLSVRDGAVTAAWTSVSATARLRATLAMPAESASGGRWSAGAASGAIPAQAPPPAEAIRPLAACRAASAGLAAAAGPWIRLDAAEELAVTVGERPWPQRAAEVVLAGNGPGLELRIASPGGVTIAEPDGPVVAGADWLPLPYDGPVQPGSACDLSVLSGLDAPAGRHGAVRAVGEHFEFAGRPGVAQRFYGVNLVAGTQFLDPEASGRLVERIVRAGYNSVRLHHWDKLVFPGGDGSAPDPARLAALDRLTAMLTRRGIYLTIDLYCSRDAAPEALGLPAGEAVGQPGVKMALAVSPAAVAWWRRGTLALLDHVNAETGVRWADDPAWIGMCLVNEGTFENWHAAMLTRPGLRALWQARWNAWLLARHGGRDGLVASWGVDPGGDPAAGTVPLPAEISPGPAAAELLLCYADAEEELFARLSRIVREEARCRAPLTGTNGWTKRVVNQPPRMAQDYVDDHWYVDHPSEFADRATWKPPFSVQQHEPTLTAARGPRYAATLRLAGKPFTASEVNFCAPGRHRASGGLITGAIAGLQDWAGVWRYSLAHTREQLDADARASFFDVATDPLTMASEGIAIALFLRGDLAPASGRAVFAIPREAVRAGDRQLAWMGPAWSWAAWVTRVATTIGDDPAAVGRWGGNDDAWAWEPAVARRRLAASGAIAAGNPSDPSRFDLASDGGAVRLDGPGGRLLVDTARSGGAWLLPGSSAELPRLGLGAEVAGSAAAVTAIALDGEALAGSRRILVSHLTEQQNSGLRFATPRGDRVLDPGGLPHLVRAGRAVIRLAMAEPSAYEVWALSPGGRRLARVPVAITAGRLVFTADPSLGVAAGTPCLHYEVVRR